MNIFATNHDPVQAAADLCDKHIPKMCVETAQMLAAAQVRHGRPLDQMPLTQAGTPYKGGYKSHPCTLWCGDNSSNYIWLARHGQELCRQYTMRFDKTHACAAPIDQLADMTDLLPVGLLTPHALAMPDCYKQPDHVSSYRSYYRGEKMHFARWDHGPAPAWLGICGVVFVREAC